MRTTIFPIGRRERISIQSISDKDKYTAQPKPQKPLNIAVLNGNIETVLDLLKSGANPEEKDGCHGNSGMHWAVKADNIEVLELYRGRGFDLSVKNDFNWTPLHIAAEGCHRNSLVWLINNGVDVNSENSMMETPLSRSISRGHIETAIILFERGANLKHKDKRGKNFLHIANKLPLLEWLVQNKLDINGKDNLGRTPLHDAAESFNLEKACFLLEHGADLEAQDHCGCTPLYTAARIGKTEFVRLLLSKGANPAGTVDSETANDKFIISRKEACMYRKMRLDNINRLSRGSKRINFSTGTNRSSNLPQRDKSLTRSFSHLELEPEKGSRKRISTQPISDEDKFTAQLKPQQPLNIAVLNGNIETVLELLKSGANPEEKDGFFGKSGMHWAAKADNIAVLELYRGRGLDLSVRDNLNWTPLHIAAECCRYRSVIWLLNNGVDIDSEDCFMHTPLFKAVNKGHIGVAKLLFERGADLKHTEGWGKNLLHCANTLPLLEWLVENKLDINAKDDWGRTPLHDAVKSSSLEKAIFLLEKGADIDAKDRKGRTPLYEAAKSGKIELVRLFLKWGADSKSIFKDGSSPKEVTNNIKIKTLLPLKEDRHLKNGVSSFDKINK
ncbi:putative ankyrin repeat protein RF_0381 isoform X2 [Halyomorpha halys]|uniref:putative ankyrin repeat protein RF_0381 isoform X2 n=1 Tax=Halyomorpha halys TaxID=286706 RepID=UPI0006D4FA6E|nr:uncharacterized protein LOC106692811 isoform X2 [Halyomorpha halys]